MHCAYSSGTRAMASRVAACREEDDDVDDPVAAADS